MLPKKGLPSQSYVFSSSHVWMWELYHKEGWAPKNWCFWTWCWRRLLRVPWTAKRSNQSTLKEISPGCSLEGLMLKLKLNILATWCEELTQLKRLWCWERLRAGGEGDDRGWDGWMASLTLDRSLNKLRELVTDREALCACSPWGCKELDMTVLLNWSHLCLK